MNPQEDSFAPRGQHPFPLARCDPDMELLAKRDGNNIQPVPGEHFVPRPPVRPDLVYIQNLISIHATVLMIVATDVCSGETAPIKNT